MRVPPHKRVYMREWYAKNRERVLKEKKERRDAAKEEFLQRERRNRARLNGYDNIYNPWANMIERCTNPKHHRYHRYGGRGIKVCKRWRRFKNFAADMAPRPKGKSLDRWPNPDGDYKPSNCRWATSKEQRNNYGKNAGKISAAQKCRI
jgi:hypothetical protein